MGRWFEALFRQAGLEPLILDREDLPQSRAAAASSDIIMLAAPVSAVKSVMEAIGQFIRPNALLMDISSVKKRPLHFMLEHSRCEVIGTHPFFGPSAASLSGQTIFLCPARGETWLSRLRLFLRSQNARVLEISPDEHDRLMACFQTLRHMLLTALGQTVVKLGYDPVRHAEVMGEWFQQLMTIWGHQLRQPAELYANMAIENPYSHEALIVFQESLSNLVDSIAAQNRDQLIAAMEEHIQCCDLPTTQPHAADGWRRSEEVILDKGDSQTSKILGDS